MGGQNHKDDEEEFVPPVGVPGEPLHIPPEWYSDPPDAGVREPRRPIVPSAAGQESAEPPG